MRRGAAGGRVRGGCQLCDLYLQALGLRYADIMRATGSSYTAVNRRLSEGRAHLRRLERELGAGEADEG